MLSQYADLKQQVSILETANSVQREILQQTSAELEGLRKKYSDLQTAHALTAVSEDRERAKRHIASLVTKINNAIDLIASDLPEADLTNNGNE